MNDNSRAMRLKNVHLAVQASAAVQEFYVALLGPPLFADGDQWIQYQSGGVAVALAGPREVTDDMTGWTPSFEVDDLEATIDELSTRGGRHISTRSMGDHGRAATLTDPVGNRLVLWSASA